MSKIRKPESDESLRQVDKEIQELIKDRIAVLVPSETDDTEKPYMLKHAKAESAENRIKKIGRILSLLELDKDFKLSAIATAEKHGEAFNPRYEENDLRQILDDYDCYPYESANSRMLLVPQLSVDEAFANYETSVKRKCKDDYEKLKYWFGFLDEFTTPEASAIAGAIVKKLYSAALKESLEMIEILRKFIEEKIGKLVDDKTNALALSKVYRNEINEERKRTEIAKKEAEIVTTWDIAVNDGILKKDGEYYRIASGGIARFATDFADAINKYNKEKKTNYSFPPKDEIHRLLRNKNGKQYAESSINVTFLSSRIERF